MTHRILLVDPNKTIRLAAQMVFAKTPDIILATAMNSFDALDKMHLLKPTLTLMDEELAKELCFYVKRLPSPVLVLHKPLTSKGLTEQVRSALLKMSHQSEEEHSHTQTSKSDVQEHRNHERSEETLSNLSN
ncbi:MAG: hypothetical protein WCK49_05990 [Myxococcaceae bacterium]